MPELVSILIPVYNACPWVAQAIESALAQTWSNKEIIVLDDGSTDGSIEVIKRYAGSIRIESSAHGGQNVSRNLLTQLSRGDWLVFLDADDEIAPDSVEQKMRQACRAEVIYGSVNCCKFAGRALLSSIRTVAEDHEDVLAAVFSWKLPNTSAYAFQKEALLAAGGWDESVRKFTDYAMCIPLLLRGCRFKAAPMAWSMYREWSITQASQESTLESAIVWLQLIRSAAEELEQRSLMTPARRQAIFDSTLGTIRRLYRLDRRLALLEHRALLDRSLPIIPSTPPFSANYRRLYRCVGFALAERVTALRRRFEPLWSGS